MKWLRKFYYWIKDSATMNYIDSRGIHLNSRSSSIFNPMSYQDCEEDKRTKEIVWNKHVKPIILWSIPGIILGLPLLIVLAVFLAPVIIAILFFVGIPIALIAGIIYIILNW